MPQGRHKVPFSAKQKKLQLQQKRDRKRQAVDDETDVLFGSSKEDVVVSGASASGIRGLDDSDPYGINRLNQQPTRAVAVSRTKLDPNRYRLHFLKETEEEIERRKRQAHQPIEMLSEDALEIGIDEVFLPGSELDMPKRPPWDYSLSKEQVDAQENRYFRNYVTAIESRFVHEDLSYFELNLETWRQLWRVLEMSDVVLIVVDARFPVLLFSPALYHHVTEELHKAVILVLNKIDLVPPSLVVAWKYYFKDKFPALHIICFTSFPATSPKGIDFSKKMPKIQRRRGRLRMAAEGALQVFEACYSIVSGEVDLSAWRQKISSELNDFEDEEEDTLITEEPIAVKKLDTEFQSYEKFKDQILTLGCIGQPNVGKSSVINALVGKKVVSVSRTPGHTKHFQTIFLTQNVRLCDCPGLVFPSKISKALQVIAGSYPVAQLREPYSSVLYLAERLPLPKILGLQHSEDWSAFLICDAWAEKRGFKTAKAARNDTYRAANHILRLALDGRLCLSLRPPAYNSNKEKWQNHQEIATVVQLITRKKELGGTSPDVEPNFEEDEEEEEEDEPGAEESESDEDGAPVVLAAKGGGLRGKNKFALLSSHE